MRPLCGRVSLAERLGTKDPEIGVLRLAVPAFPTSSIEGEPGGSGRNPMGEEPCPTAGFRAVCFPPGTALDLWAGLIGGSGESPRMPLPPTRAEAPARSPERPGLPHACATPAAGCARVRTRPRAGAHAYMMKDPGLESAPGPFMRAVAEGFEPSVTCATLAFEASSFGRSDTLPGESLAQGGPCSEIGIDQRSARPSRASSTAPSRGPRKNAVSCSAHCASSTPWITSGRWLSRRSRTTSQSEPAAPAFSSRAP